MRSISPLRYPGGKAKLTPYIQSLISLNDLVGCEYVEPYAGGASVALSLVMNGSASTVHINDFDRRIYAFWYSILNNCDEFCDKIESIPINIEEWNKQKSILKNFEEYDLFDIGFSTFFLNRTNISGILKAGVIGGQSQQGNWKIDARFNKKKLIKKIQEIHNYKKGIKVYNQDALDFINQIHSSVPVQNSFYYLDPPYYNKGQQLYLNFYRPEDHSNISSLLENLDDTYWIVSYDNVDQIKNHYSKFRQQEYCLNYYAGKATVGKEIIIYSDTLKNLSSIKKCIIA